MKQIGKIKRIYWIIAAAVMLLVVGGFAGYQYWYLPSQIVESEDSTLQTSVVRKGDIILYAAGSGELIPSAEVEVSFDISDGVQEELIELLVDVGDAVEEGMVLARLDESDRQDIYSDAQRELRELTSPSAIAELEIDLAETMIEMDDDIDNLVGLISPAVYKAEGYVEEYTQALADAQAAFEADSSDNNEAILKSVEQNLKWANSNLQVQWQYYEDEYVTENFENYYWDGNEKVWYSDGPTDAEIASVRAQINLAEATISELEVLLTALNSGQQVPDLATGSEASKIRDAQQALDEALKDLENTNLVAPISGIVTEVNVDVSEMVGSEVVLVISDLTPPTLDTYYDESDWKNVQEGFPVEVIFDALPDNVYQGQVVHVDPGLVSQQNTTVVYAVVELDITTTGWDDLPVGSAAGVDVIGGKAESAVLVPVEALREISDGEYAVFVMEDGVPRMKMVEVGLQDVIYAEIISGLKQGDVVTTGQVETAQ